jgi:hypothetical protein
MIDMAGRGCRKDRSLSTVLLEKFPRELRFWGSPQDFRVYLQDDILAWSKLDSQPCAGVLNYIIVPTLGIRDRSLAYDTGGRFGGEESLTICVLFCVSRYLSLRSRSRINRRLERTYQPPLRVRTQASALRP